MRMGSVLQPCLSLRRHDPDQVRRVRASALSQSLKRDPPENGADFKLWRAPVNGVASGEGGFRALRSGLAGPCAKAAPGAEVFREICEEALGLLQKLCPRMGEGRGFRVTPWALAFAGAER